MKAIKPILILMIALLFTGALSAQVSIGLGINLGTPAPRYYYLQDIEAYYDIQASMYIYLSGGRWIHARRLPASYGNYDYNTGHRVIINDYRGNSPYRYYNEHRRSFPKGRYGNGNDNHWSMKDHKNPGNKQFQKVNQKQAKDIRNNNKRVNKEFKKDNKRNNNGSFNKNGGKGNNPGNGKANHAGNDKGGGKNKGHK